MKCCLILLFMLMNFVATAANAEIYKWVDENGVTQYTHKPPPKDKSQYKTFGKGSGEQPDKVTKAKPQCGEPAPGYYASKKSEIQQQYQKKIQQCSDETGPLKLSDAQKKRCVDNKQQELKDTLTALEREKAEKCRDEMLRRVTADNNPEATTPDVKDDEPEPEENKELSNEDNDTEANETADDITDTSAEQN